MSLAAAKVDRETLADLRPLIGHFVERAFELMGLSKKEVAYRLQYHDAGTISRWCTGIERPLFDKLFTLDGFDVAYVLAIAERNHRIDAQTVLTIRASESNPGPDRLVTMPSPATSRGLLPDPEKGARLVRRGIALSGLQSKQITDKDHGQFSRECDGKEKLSFHEMVATWPRAVLREIGLLLLEGGGADVETVVTIRRDGAA